MFRFSHNWLGTPRLVIELFRHGARGPLKTEDAYWRGLEGKLTTLGKAQHYVLGAALIQKYPHLSSILKTNERIYLRSTEFTRTKQSMEYHLLGMYEASDIPVHDISIYNNNFAQVIRGHDIYESFMNSETKTVQHIYNQVNVVPFEDDLEFLCTELKACPNSFKLLTKEDEATLETNINPVREALYKNIGINFPGTEFRYFYDYLLANSFEGRLFPDGMSEELWAYVKLAGEYYVTFRRFGNEIQKKIFPIFLLNKILDFLHKAQQDSFPYDLILLSAHDVTIFNFLNAMNILTPSMMLERMKNMNNGHNENSIHDFPNFASQLLIELWEAEESKNADLVRVIYENKPLKLGKNKQEFNTISTLQELFEAAYTPYSVSDVHRFCGRKCVEKQIKAPKEVKP